MGGSLLYLFDIFAHEASYHKLEASPYIQLGLQVGRLGEL